MKLHIILLTILSFIPLCEIRAEDKFEPIFNGKDLQGWEVPDNNIWWLVEDGILQVRSGPEQKGSILWTEKEYEDFVVELEFKFGAGTVDSGVHIRNTDQIQIGISGSLKRDMTASPYIPKKGYPVEAEGVKEILRMDDWNQMRIEVRGMEYIVHLNGKKVMSYNSETGIPKGPIGLQLHGNKEMEIDFRDIKLAEITK